MKKILVIHQGLIIESSLIKLYNSFGNDYVIKIICPKKISYGLGFGDGVFIKEKFAEYNNVEIIPVDLINDKNSFLRTLYKSGIYKLIKDFHPDIIHCFNEIFSPTLSQVIFIRNLIDKTIKIVNYSWENLDWTKKFPHNIFGKYSAKRINKVICANNQSITEVKKFGVNESNIEKIYWGVDFSNFEYIRHSIDGKNEFRIGFIGRLLKDKGLQNLIEAMDTLGANYTLDIIGDGTDSEYFKELSKNLKISNRINFIGKVEYKLLKDYIRNFDIFVLPSISKPYWEEQFGRVLVEMMASGVPVIGSSSGAIPEVIGDRGFIFEEGNSKDLSDKIKSLSENKDLYDSFVVKAYDYALANYSQKVFTDRLKALYQSI